MTVLLISSPLLLYLRLPQRTGAIDLSSPERRTVWLADLFLGSVRFKPLTSIDAKSSRWPIWKQKQLRQCIGQTRGNGLSANGRRGHGSQSRLMRYGGQAVTGIELCIMTCAKQDINVHTVVAAYSGRAHLLQTVALDMHYITRSCPKYLPGSTQPTAIRGMAK